MLFDVDLTLGHVLRHAPGRGRAGLEAALLDIAQDLMLGWLHERGVIDGFVFKGGRRSESSTPGQRAASRPTSTLRFGSPERTGTLPGRRWPPKSMDSELGPSFTVRRRGKPYVTIDSDLGGVDALTCKLDVNPPPWLRSSPRGWVPLPVHLRYGGVLPRIHVVRLEENVAEKIARLNRATPARDAYDLVWVMQRWRRRADRPLDLALIRRLAVLKIWVDLHGLTAGDSQWTKGHDPVPLDVDHWLRYRGRTEFDDENIGLLAAPPPSLLELGKALAREYRFLGDLDSEERILARGHGGDRSLVLRVLSELHDTQLPLGVCW